MTVFESISDTYHKQAVERLVNQQGDEVMNLQRDRLINNLKKELESS